MHRDLQEHRRQELEIAHEFCVHPAILQNKQPVLDKPIPDPLLALPHLRIPLIRNPPLT